MPPLPTLMEMRRVLEKAGFTERRRNGGHIVYGRHDGERLRIVPVSHGRGAIRTTRLFRAMLDQAGMTEEEFRSLM